MDDDKRLLDMAKERGHYKPRCQHINITLCQHEHEVYGWFAIYQCDDCGLPLDLEVSEADMEDGQNLPLLDVPMAEAATDAIIGGDVYKTFQFFSKAIGR